MLHLISFLRQLQQEDLNNTRFEIAELIEIFIRQIDRDYLSQGTLEDFQNYRRLRLLLTVMVNSLKYTT